MAIQSLWSSAWMIHVTGFSRTQAANHLAAMNVAMVVAYALIDTLQASGHSVVIAHRTPSPRSLSCNSPLTSGCSSAAE